MNKTELVEKVKKWKIKEIGKKYNEDKSEIEKITGITEEEIQEAILQGQNKEISRMDKDGKSLFCVFVVTKKGEGLAQAKFLSYEALNEYMNARSDGGALRLKTEPLTASELVEQWVIEE